MTIGINNVSEVVQDRENGRMLFVLQLRTRVISIAVKIKSINQYRGT